MPEAINETTEEEVEGCADSSAPETIKVGGCIFTSAKDEPMYNAMSLSGYWVRMTDQIRNALRFRSLRCRIYNVPSGAPLENGNFYQVSVRNSTFFHDYKSVLWNAKSKPGFRYPAELTIETEDRYYVRCNRASNTNAVYYRYDEATQEWKYIGAVTDAYYKAYCDVLFTCAAKRILDRYETDRYIYVAVDDYDSYNHAASSFGTLYAVNPQHIGYLKNHITDGVCASNISTDIFTQYSINGRSATFKMFAGTRKLTLYACIPKSYTHGIIFDSDGVASNNNAKIDIANSFVEDALYFVPDDRNTVQASGCSFRQIPSETARAFLTDDSKHLKHIVYMRLDPEKWCYPIDVSEPRRKEECFSRLAANGTAYWFSTEEARDNACICDVCGDIVALDYVTTIEGYNVCNDHSFSSTIPSDSPLALICGYHNHSVPMKMFVTPDKYIRKRLDSYAADYEDNLKATESFKGLGFELEVDDCENSDTERSIMNNIMANVIRNMGGNVDDTYFETDGSLNTGFEIISQPHTVEAFWGKKQRWADMLSKLRENGYHSHDAGTCGLHVHVSRGMFGDSTQIQDLNIAKVYSFFDKYWSDIKKVSRRESTSYCGKNEIASRGNCDDTELACVLKVKSQSDNDKCRGSSHHVALNNGNSATFEYRLGRGTLNAESFFAWIDFVLTVTKNAAQYTAEELNTNKTPKMWLTGLQSTTAAYIYKRNAFKEEIKALYPDVISILDNISVDINSDDSSRA